MPEATCSAKLAKSSKFAAHRSDTTIADRHIARLAQALLQVKASAKGGTT
jgi:hypothetical protein